MFAGKTDACQAVSLRVLVDGHKRYFPTLVWYALLMTDKSSPHTHTPKNKKKKKKERNKDGLDKNTGGVQLWSAVRTRMILKTTTATTNTSKWTWEM